MFTFIDHIQESTNTHIRHVEDSIFLDGSSGIVSVVGILSDIVRNLGGSSKTSVYLSVKWDGAPAVILGQDPKTKDFFVASKSLFNKTPKVNYSHGDIDKNHGNSPGLADKLHVVFDSFKKLGVVGILQGDLMFTKSDISIKSIDGQDCIIFQPNTITYAIPVNTDLAKKIKNSNVGIVFHTAYSGNSLTSLSASYGPNVNYLTNAKDVWVANAGFVDASGIANLTNNETQQINKLMSQISSYSSGVVPNILDKIQKSPKVKDVITRYFNNSIRAGIDRGGVPALLAFAETGKSDTTIIQFIRNHASELKQAFILHSIIASAKNMIIDKMNQVKNIGTFFATPDGFKVANPEGFVAVSPQGNVYKLVDRLEFSRQNFNAVKNWV